MTELMADAVASRPAETSEQEGIKDTLESIVVALILAFVFRAFIVEAFVIPTGSMAPTLYGAHGTIICEDCGVEFAYGVRDLAETRSGVSVRTGSRAICPNCNHPNTNLLITDENRNREKGDRILVLKWPFDIGGPWLRPARWDVIVFKDPADGVTNFIKRLAGLPNEVLMIVDGDVYMVPTTELSPETLAELEQIRREKYLLRTNQRHGRLRRVPDEVLAELDEKMRIARKTEAAQRSLWFRVYEHDFPPRRGEDYQPRWVARAGDASGWDPARRRLRFEDRGVESDYIELHGKRIRSTCAYNIYGNHTQPVSDLRVRLVLTPLSRDGALSIRLEKSGRVFWATVGLDGSVSLVESADGPAVASEPMAMGSVPALTLGESVEVSFENVDYRLALSIGGEEVLASSSDPASSAYYAPDLQALRRSRPRVSSPPRIYASDGVFEMSHLVVERDVYYFHDETIRALKYDWAPRSGWGSAESPILLREHEFFMLGDNTSASKDSRLWDEPGDHLTTRGEDFQLGTVPEDQLIGKAFFVYWPSGYRVTWLPRIGSWTWPIIPDVGRMRWIR